MPRLSSRRSRSVALVLWVLALALPHGARGPVSAHLRTAPLPGHAGLRPLRSRRDVDVEHATLGYARASTFIPGTNMPGEAGGAAWVFLLPSLELDLVLCLGAPSAAALRTLARGADEVVVCCGRRERWALRRRGIARVRVGTPGAPPAHQPDLGVVSGCRAAEADPRL